MTQLIYIYVLKDLTKKQKYGKHKNKNNPGMEGKMKGSLVDKYIETAPRLTRAGNINDYFTSLPDREAVELLVKFEKYDRRAAKGLLAKMRELTQKECDYGKGSINTLVRAGFTLKEHAPKFGPCYDNWQRLRGCNLPDDKPTSDCLLIGVPRLLFKDETCNNELALLGQLRAKYELPAHFFTPLRSAAEQAGLVLNHFRHTGERTPLNDEWVRTATCLSDGYRLVLGFFDEGVLFCDAWFWDDGRYPFFGVFALGVVELGP